MEAAISAAGAPDARARKLTLDETRLALRNLKPNAWLMLLLGAAACVMFSRWVTPGQLGLWLGLVAVGGLFQAATAARFVRADPPAADARRWIVICTAGYAAFALSWASMGLFLWVPGENLNQMLILLLLGCTLAGNTALTGACRPLTIAGLTIYGGALVALPLREGGVIYNTLSVMALFYLGYIAHLSGSIHATAREHAGTEGRQERSDRGAGEIQGGLRRRARPRRERKPRQIGISGQYEP